LPCTNKQNKKNGCGQGWRHVVSGFGGRHFACRHPGGVRGRRSGDPRYDTVNRSLAKARNESILLNIIRSSHDWPMSFRLFLKSIPACRT
jgi:hypothetical protein